MEVLLLTKHIKLVQVAKAFLEPQEGFKGKRKSKALIANSEQMGTKRAFKSKEMVKSNSKEKEEEERVCMIKKIKHKHIEELIGASKRKEVVELQTTVASKMPVAGPLHSISKLVLISSMTKSVLKMLVVSTTPIAGPSNMWTVPSSAPKIITTASVPKPAPVTSTGKPAIKGASIIKDPFMVRQCKLAGTEESGVLIINQVTEVSVGKVAGAAMQETLQSNKDIGNKNNDGEGDNDHEGNDDNDAAMDIDTSSLVMDMKFLELLHLEEAYQGALMKAKKVIKDIAPAPDYKFLYNSNKIIQALTIGTTKCMCNRKRQQECWKKLEGVLSQCIKN
ncbi:hypothetical protein C0995_003197 [Termitomyces sp. Mi166|nr:hypothetical protein C0995_003197 [Termitomyces sp. Mi166\